MPRLFAIFFLLLLLPIANLHAEDGYRLWMRYEKISNPRIAQQYQHYLKSLAIVGNSPTINAAKSELTNAVKGFTGSIAALHSSITPTSNIIIGTAAEIQYQSFGINQVDLTKIGEEGFIIRSTKSKKIIITANSEVGVLYGVFQFLRLIQTEQSIEHLNIISAPRIKLRLLNHWDNLNRTVERGYAGFSIWNWHTLPLYIDQRYIDYARANASIGINGTVLTNVNANATVLSKPYLEKVKALADAFRPYGIKVYLTARFSAPVEIGGLKTADPLNPAVKEWWSTKIAEIYSLIPDFGGFLIKANSEGQPGPQDYGRSHADGANMFADAIAPYHGVIMWRAFVYSHDIPDDRHKQAFTEFVPLDGTFRSNVIVQVKNGAIDFMPREPFHPLFGAMPKTPLMVEFQVTQEYLGQGTHLVYLASLFKECLESDTYSNGKGSTVAKIVDGSVDQHTISGMAGVANIGSDINWTGHPFAQANWYAIGRLSWDHTLTAGQIADEWLRLSFTNDQTFVSDLKKIMLSSREILVRYMNPNGLHHIMATGHHYGPGPWVNDLARADWNPVYYHKADSVGIGFNRTVTGSNAIAQYKPAAAAKWNNPTTCDEKYLLWFHHVSWNYQMKSGRSLWNEICYQYNTGVDSVQWMQTLWAKQQQKVDPERFKAVTMLLNIQYNDAKWWRNACLLYFQTFSKMPIPDNYEKADHSLDYYKQLKFPYAPGN